MTEKETVIVRAEDIEQVREDTEHVCGYYIMFLLPDRSNTYLPLRLIPPTPENVHVMTFLGRSAESGDRLPEGPQDFRVIPYRSYCGSSAPSEELSRRIEMMYIRSLGRVKYFLFVNKHGRDARNQGLLNVSEKLILQNGNEGLLDVSERLVIKKDDDLNSRPGYRTAAEEMGNRFSQMTAHLDQSFDAAQDFIRFGESIGYGTETFLLK